MTAIKNKSTFAIAKSIFFCFFRRNFATEIKNKDTMNTLNKIRAFELIKKISKEIEKEHAALIDLMRKAETFEVQACKARKEYKKIIFAAVIDCKRVYNIADRYFNNSGRVPSVIDNVNVYRIDSFSYIIRFFEL